mgnify:FL=1
MIAAVLLLSPLLYHLVYKPRRAGTLIERGIVEIRRAAADPKRKEIYFAGAESLFRDVENDYVGNSADFCNAYGDAYLRVSEYDLSLQKFIRSLSIKRDNPATLFHLGRFFAGMPEDYFNRFNRAPLNRWIVFPRSLSLKTRQDYALFFYGKSLMAGGDNAEAVKGMRELLSSR